MATHTSSVNFKNLIQDLSDMYTSPVHEVIILELIANALDAKAQTIKINYNPSNKVLSFSDDGTGMTKEQFSQYHDFAAGLKKKGNGIGFAGVGAKISFNIANRVVSRTKSATFSGGSDWRLANDNTLQWSDINGEEISASGTWIDIYFPEDFENQTYSYESIKQILLTNYLPLIINQYIDFYSKMKIYSKNLTFYINDTAIEKTSLTKLLNLTNQHDFILKSSKGRRFGLGEIGLSAEKFPLETNGMLICTYGKIVNSELFNQFPGEVTGNIIGLVEVPELVSFLTTAKNSFAKRGNSSKFNELWEPIKVEFIAWLRSIGAESTSIDKGDETYQLERILKKISSELPELERLFRFSTKSSALAQSKDGSINSELVTGVDFTYPDTNGESNGGDGVTDPGKSSGEAIVDSENGTIKAKPISRKRQNGPKIGFINSPQDIRVAWVEGQYIYINSGHASYIKHTSNQKAIRLQNFLAISVAIQRLLNEDGEADNLFIDTFLKHWACG